jgi:Protein of unknown function DUF262
MANYPPAHDRRRPGGPWFKIWLSVTQMGVFVYQIRSESVKTFIDDPRIELPRFQRKPTWKTEQNFRLALSVFKGYPIGAVVIKLDGQTADPAAMTKYLLDGRQRRDALTRMLNPETIYDWARSVLRLRSKMPPNEVADFFWTYVDEYFGRDVEDLLEPSEEEQWASPVDLALQEETAAEEEFGNSDKSLQQDQGSAEAVPPDSLSLRDPEGLKALLRTILLVHPRRGAVTELTRAFDFTKQVNDIDYYVVDPATGKTSIDGRKLIQWVGFKKAMAPLTQQSYPPDKELFAQWITEKAEPVSQTKLLQGIEQS